MSEEKCICSMVASGGEASPRMWICPKCGETAFIGTRMVIEGIATKYKCTFKEAWYIAYGYLTLKKVETASKGGIYFCEDYFNRDLREKFL
jgi:hypothetical protein